MKIVNCSACGVCMEKILSCEFICPSNAFLVPLGSYPTATINHELCTDCGLCLKEIGCLGEAIKK